MEWGSNEHKELFCRFFLNRYNIPLNEIPDKTLPGDLEWCFMSIGAGECIDSFFAFGFLEISKATDDYPIELNEQPRRKRTGYPKCSAILNNAAPHRGALDGATGNKTHLWDLKNLGGTAFTIQAREHENSSMSSKDFINLCQRENKRRLAPYDSRLARPKLIPRIMSGASFFL